MENVKLKFTDDSLHSISVKAIKRKTGARGLRSILEGILLDTMFELPGLEDVEEIAVNSGTLCNVTITVNERRPLELVMPFFRTLTGLS